MNRYVQLAQPQIVLSACNLYSNIVTTCVQAPHIACSVAILFKINIPDMVKLPTEHSSGYHPTQHAFRSSSNSLQSLHSSGHQPIQPAFRSPHVSQPAFRSQIQAPHKACSVTTPHSLHSGSSSSSPQSLHVTFQVTTLHSMLSLPTQLARYHSGRNTLGLSSCSLHTTTQVAKLPTHFAQV